MKQRYLPFLLSAVPFLFGYVTYLKQNPELPAGSNTWFSGSGLCVLCHDTHAVALRDASGIDVSPVSQWRSTMLANASKDPFWRAKVRHEGLENPSHKEALENVCTRCHAPMGMINAFMNETGNYTFDQLYRDDIGKDGISCTVCHQVDNFHFPEFSGNFTINTSKEIYGPFPNPVVQQMLINTGYTPVYNDQINQSRLCGSCHTLFTHTVDADGEYTGDVFTEQALYHEWENSIFSQQNIGCQTCHMPRIEEAIKITSRPLFLPGRQPFGQHTLTGGNLFMLTLLKENHEALGLHSGTDFLQMTIDRTRQMLTSETADLAIEEIIISNDSVYIPVSIRNKAGHKFPTGFPSRRAYLECLITSGTDTIFHSGRQGSYALVRFDPESFEPHHEVINNEDQVQIYEFVMADTDGKVTTILERAWKPLKDNRLVPNGFRDDHQNYDTVQVVGRANDDVDYFSAAGIEYITYVVPQPDTWSDATVKVTLHYETVPESWLKEMFAYADKDDDISRFKMMYQASGNKAVEIASDTKTIVATSVPGHFEHPFRVYPNPSGGRITIDGVTRDVRYSLYSAVGKHMHQGLLRAGSNYLNLDVPPGVYFLVFHALPYPYTSSLVINW